MKGARYYLKNGLRRLGSMEQGELSHLIRRRLWIKKARFLTSSRLKRGHSNHYRRWNDSGTGSYDKRRPVRFYFDLEDKENIRKTYKEQFGNAEDAISHKADRYCSKEFAFLGANSCFDSKINWRYDPISGREWPKKFIKDIVYTGQERIGDIKLPWELNRHQYLVVLAQAYYLSDDSKYAKEVVSSIRSWIRDNPPYVGINWISALEVGIRLISWVWAFHLIKSSDEVTHDFIGEFLASVEKQVEYVRVNLTIGRYANNHLIGEAASLALVGMYFKELKNANQWVNKGLSILEKEALKQIHPDGGGVEQAAGYLRFNLEFFLLAFLLAKKNSIMVSSKVMARLEKAFEFIMITLMPDGKAPTFGDADDARAIFLSSGEYWDFRGILALGAVLFDRSDFKWVAGGPSEELLWLLGPKGFEAYKSLNAEEPERQSYLFKASGYAVMRNSWNTDANYLILDCGPLGYKSGGHGHADALSIQMSAFGCQVLVDPGTFAYNQDQTYRNYFRSTRAHNTVSVDGKDQAEITGRMSWESIPTTVIHDYYFSDELDMISAENDGYRRLASPVMHQRTLIFCKNPLYYLVIDKMTANDVHAYTLNFHFPPGTLLKDQNPVLLQLPTDGNVLLELKSSCPLSMKVNEGDLTPMGWYSDRYGHKTPSPALSFLCNTNDTAFFYSLIVPYVGKDPAISSFDAYRDAASSILVADHDSFVDTWLINDSPLETAYDSVLFAGKCAFIRRSLKGPLVRACVIGATKLRVDGQIYLDSGKPVSGIIVESLAEE